MLTGYEGKARLVVKATGTGDSDELIGAGLPQNDAAYALVRVTMKYDEIDTVKFVFIEWLGSSTGGMRKGIIGTHAGAVKDLFDPYHNQVIADSPSEIKPQVLLDLVSDTAGTRSRERRRSSGSKKGGSGKSGARSGLSALPPQTTSKVKVVKSQYAHKVQEVSKTALTVPVADEDDVKADIAAVRDNDSETTWMAIKYTDKKASQLVSGGSGVGGVKGLRKALESFELGGFGLVRLEQKMKAEGTVAVQQAKFVRVIWISGSAPPMFKARMGTHTAFAREFIGDSHAEITTSDGDDLDPKTVQNLVDAANGTRDMTRKAKR